jgi:two-component system, response regulator
LRLRGRVRPMNELSQLLLIEDNPDDHESTIRGFRKANLLNPVHWCPNGLDALDYLYKRGKYAADPDAVMPALILLDLNMPGMDGRQLLATIKSDANLKRVPVIVLTTSSDMRDINECYDLGASTYIQKPVGFESLIEAAARLNGYWFGVAMLPQLAPPEA